MKITKQNYLTEAAKIDLSMADDALKEGHKFATDYIQLYGEDDDITEAIDLQIELMNDWANRNKEAATKPKKRAKAVRPKPRQQAKSKNDCDCEDKPSGAKSKRYSVVRKAAKPKSEKPRAKPKSEKPTAKPKAEKPTAKPKAEKPTAKPKAEKPTAKPKTQKPTAKPKAEKPTAKREPARKVQRINDIHLLAKRYKNLDGSRAQADTLKALFSDVQEYILLNKPKSDTLRGEIADYLQRQLQLMLTGYKPGATIELNKEDKERIAYFANVELSKAIALLQRYVNLPKSQNPKLVGGKLLADIKKAIEGKQVKTNSKLYPYLNEVRERLENGNYAPTQVMLRGLSKIII